MADLSKGLKYKLSRDGHVYLGTNELHGGPRANILHPWQIQEMSAVLKIVILQYSGVDMCDPPQSEFDHTPSDLLLSCSFTAALRA